MTVLERVESGLIVVIRFTGDSVLVFWPDVVGGTRHAVLQAARCADAICQDAQQDPGAPAATVQSAFHAGV